MKVELLLDNWSQIWMDSSFSQQYLKPGERIKEIRVQHDDGTMEYFIPKPKGE